MGDIGAENTTLHGAANGGHRGLVGGSLVGSQRVGASGLVDNHAHAHLAVAALGLCAVDPDWLGVGHGDSEDLRTFTFLDRNESRVDTLTSGERLARLVEGGLGDGVVGGEIVVFNLSAYFSDDLVVCECQAILANVDPFGFAFLDGAIRVV